MRPRIAAALALGLLAGLYGCRSPAPRPQAHPPTYAPLTPEQDAELDALRSAADANPDDYAANKEAGLRLMDYALSGALPQQVEAEHYLERAYALRSDDEELLRSLGRFYNMRAVENDFSKADMQIEVYAALLGDEAPQDMAVDHFVAYGFFVLAQTIQAADEGHMLRAFARLRRLERDLRRRTHAQPDVVELHALAGNFALFFAGYVPTGKRRRLERGIEHFEYVKGHWAQMRAGARDEQRCPNTYENFVFELAEAHLAMGGDDRAAEIYRELSSIRGSATRGKELVAAVSRHRLEHLPAYTGRTELMPPWPSDLGNCIVCHAYTGQLPEQTLWIAPGLEFDLSATPTNAEPRPVGTLVARDLSPPSDDPLENACAACHAPGGRARHLLDVTDPASVWRHRTDIIEAVDSGRMPPDDVLDAGAKRALREYVDGLRPPAP